MLKILRMLRNDEDGITAIEYAVLAAIVVVAVAAAFGNQFEPLLDAAFSKMSGALPDG